VFKSLSQKQTARAIADHLPNGFAWIAKNNESNLNKLLNGLAAEFVRTQQDLQNIAVDYTPIKDNFEEGVFLTEWLRSYLIPDDCLKSLSMPMETILYLVAKVNGLLIFSNAQSYIDLATFFGASLVITYPAPHTILFTLTVNPTSVFPFIFPFELGSGIGDVIACIYEKAVPVHIDLTITIVEGP